MFGQPGTCPGFGDRLINGLSPPGLEALSTLPMPVMTGSSDLISFLMRSSLPLLELVLGGGLGFDPLVECLRLVSDLKRLEL
jgi:hypothetical protein